MTGTKQVPYSPASVNWQAAQMHPGTSICSTYYLSLVLPDAELTQLDQPFGLLNAVFTRFGTTNRLPTYLVGFLDLIFRTMADKHWLPVPLDDHLSLLTFRIGDFI